MGFSLPLNICANTFFLGADSGCPASLCACCSLAAISASTFCSLAQLSLSSRTARPPWLTASRLSASQKSMVARRGLATSVVMRSARAMYISDSRCVCASTDAHAAAARGGCSPRVLFCRSEFLMPRSDTLPLVLSSCSRSSPRAWASWSSAVRLKKWMASRVAAKEASRRSERASILALDASHAAAAPSAGVAGLASTCATSAATSMLSIVAMASGDASCTHPPSSPVART
mmetsp:Transcript_14294/g.33041  ORF Transcript_14294/g.33041 Transcript_14294/m.33041 type:complete len:232 (+) Transcript_14294:880-1575(+)